MNAQRIVRVAVIVLVAGVLIGLGSVSYAAAIALLMGSVFFLFIIMFRWLCAQFKASPLSSRRFRRWVRLGLVMLVIGFLIFSLTWFSQVFILKSPSLPSMLPSPSSSLNLEALDTDLSLPEPEGLLSLRLRIDTAKGVLVSIKPINLRKGLLEAQEGIILNPYQSCLDEIWRLLFLLQIGSLQEQEILDNFSKTLEKDEILHSIAQPIKQSLLRFLETSVHDPLFVLPTGLQPPTLRDVLRKHEAWKDMSDMLQSDPVISDVLNQEMNRSTLLLFIERIDPVIIRSDQKLDFDLSTNRDFWYFLYQDLIPKAKREYFKRASKAVSEIKNEFIQKAKDQSDLKLLDKNDFFLLETEQLQSQSKGWMIREQSLKPLDKSLSTGFYCYSSCPAFNIQLIDFPKDSFYSAEDARDVQIYSSGEKNTIKWSIPEVKDNGIIFIYIPSPFSYFRVILNPFIGLASLGMWFLVLIGLVFTSILLPILGAVLSEVIQERLKTRVENRLNQIPEDSLNRFTRWLKKHVSKQSRKQASSGKEKSRPGE